MSEKPASNDSDNGYWKKVSVIANGNSIIRTYERGVPGGMVILVVHYHNGVETLRMQFVPAQAYDGGPYR